MRRNDMRPFREKLLDGFIVADRGHDSSCWIWSGSIGHKGYGFLSVKGRTTLVHRLMYAEKIGPIPDGLHIDHLCRVRACVNPAHLEAVTVSENNRRAAVGRIMPLRSHCKRGHPLKGEKGKRHCKACGKQREDKRVRVWINGVRQRVTPNASQAA